MVFGGAGAVIHTPPKFSASAREYCTPKWGVRLIANFKKFMFILKHIDIIFQIDDTGIFTQNCYCNSDNCNNFNNCAENIDCVDS